MRGCNSLPLPGLLFSVCSLHRPRARAWSGQRGDVAISKIQSISLMSHATPRVTFLPTLTVSKTFLNILRANSRNIFHLVTTMSLAENIAPKKEPLSQCTSVSQVRQARTRVGAICNAIFMSRSLPSPYPMQTCLMLYKARLSPRENIVDVVA